MQSSASVCMVIVISISKLVLIATVISIAENSIIAREDGMKTVLINFSLKIVDESVTLVFRDRELKYLFNGDWV